MNQNIKPSDLIRMREQGKQDGATWFKMNSGADEMAEALEMYTKMTLEMHSMIAMKKFENEK